MTVATQGTEGFSAIAYSVHSSRRGCTSLFYSQRALAGGSVNDATFPRTIWQHIRKGLGMEPTEMDHYDNGPSDFPPPESMPLGLAVPLIKRQCLFLPSFESGPVLGLALAKRCGRSNIM